MMLTLPDVLTPDQLARCREALAGAAWVEGRTTAGHVASTAKRNLQVSQDDETGQRLAAFLLDVLGSDPRFIGAALPLKVLPPRFNRYEGGGDYDNHIDNAIFSIPGTPHRVRSDLSATLFLSDPADYDGGELVVQDTYGTHTVKLPAGHMVLYPGHSLHRVTPVTRGTRLASFFWIQSLVRDDSQRSLLHELDQAIQELAGDAAAHRSVVRLTGVYHNLLRQWADT